MTIFSFLFLGMDLIVNWQQTDLRCFQIVCIYEWGNFIVYRMTKLLDEEIEEDELFWNQDALQEVFFKFFFFFPSKNDMRF